MGAVIDAAHASAATLTDGQGNRVYLDESTYREVVAFLHMLGVAPGMPETDEDMRLTTGQAAEILDTSPRTVARLIDSGRLPGSRMGTGHRTCMLSDVMAFKRASGARAHEGLERTRAIADEEGYYDQRHDDAVSAYLDSLS